MKKALPLFLCSLFFGLNVQAAENSVAPSDAPPAQAAVREKEGKASRKTGARPIYASVAEVNAEAKTVKLGETVYAVTEKTEFHNNGQPASFDDLKPGLKIGGSWVERDGRRELVKVNVGVKQSSARGAAKSKKEEQKE